GENVGNCPEDCGPSCGNFLCEAANGETSVTCMLDCGTVCGDGVCVGDETVNGCPADCQHGYLWADAGYDTILKFTPTGTEVASIPAAGSFGAYGLAWDPVEQVLYQSDNTGAGIYKLNPETGEVLLTLEPVEEEPAGWADLAWVDGALWQVNVAADIAYKLDPQTAEVLDMIELESPHVEGLTWDGTYLWTSDTTTELLYRLNLEGACCDEGESCDEGGLCVAQ
ncbi:MAG: hypothetical protein VX938_05480, partial [Myxococcota bacterium]|nr:hypothetical protein [Myxococcota bacterium]